MGKRVIAVILAIVLTASMLLLTISFAEEAEPFTLSLEIYDADALPVGTPPGNTPTLNPLQLHKGQYITVAIRYSGLMATDGLENNGIQCLAVSLDYDAACLSLEGFDDPGENGVAGLWQNPGETTSNAWIDAALENGYTASASVRKLTTEVPDPQESGETNTRECDIRKIYLQYVLEAARVPSTVLTEDAGYLGAFTFEVKDDFTESDNITIAWEDYRFGLFEFGSFTKAFDLCPDDVGTVEHFAAPQNVQIATVDAPDPETGVSVSGKISNFAVTTGATVALYAKDEITGVYHPYRIGDNVRQPADFETEIKPLLTSAEAGFDVKDGRRHEQTFTFTNIPSGTYTLVVFKQSNFDYVIKGIRVDAEDIDLTKSEISGVKLMTLIPGDITEDGKININDYNKVVTTGVYGYSTESVPVSYVTSDLDGDGKININDYNLVVTSGIYGTSATDRIIDLGQ